MWLCGLGLMFGGVGWASDMHPLWQAAIPVAIGTGLFNYGAKKGRCFG